VEIGVIEDERRLIEDGMKRRRRKFGKKK